MALYNVAKTHPGVKIVASSEEDAATRESLKSAGVVQVTHDSLDAMLRQVDCDAVAIGDYFARRGGDILKCFAAGKHVIADKPICTKLSELEQIKESARRHKRVLGCLLDLRDSAVFRTARTLIGEGKIGDVLTANFTAQHPLLRSTRPGWYFEKGKHGGTINDIGIHAIDLLPWLTGRKLVEVVSARCWNSRVPDAPHFEEAGQFMLRLDNGGGVLGDVSYFTPDGLRYSAPQYWRITFHGTGGLIECNFSGRKVHYASADDKELREMPLEEDRPTGCLDAFIREIAGQSAAGELTSGDVFDASRRALLVQQAADEKRCRVPLQ